MNCWSEESVEKVCGGNDGFVVALTEVGCESILVVGASWEEEPILEGALLVAVTFSAEVAIVVVPIEEDVCVDWLDSVTDISVTDAVEEVAASAEVAVKTVVEPFTD